MAERDALSPCYAICGSDGPKVELALRRLRARVEDAGGAVETLEAGPEQGAEAASGADAVGACNALGLFGGLRLVLVRDVDRWREDDGAAVAAYLGAPAPETVLALVSVKPPTAGSALAHALEATGGVLQYDLPERRELPAWLRRQAQRVGARLEPEALRRLLELGGDDALSLAGELEKLALWAGGEPITVADVDALVVLEREVAPWDLTDAIGLREPERAAQVLGRYLDRRDADVARILPSLARHLRQLYSAKLLIERGAGSAAVAKELGVKEYPAKKLVQQAALWSPAELSAAIERIALVERESRGESVLRDRFTLERALVETVPAR